MLNYVPTLDRWISKSCLVGFHLIDSLDPSSPDQERILDRIYETLMFCDDDSMKTFRGRFEQLDQEILDIVRGFAREKSVVRIHDIAASSAITSVELFKKASGIPNVAVHVTASDVCTKIGVHPVSDRWKIINYADSKSHDKDGWIQAVGKKVVVNETLPLKKVQHRRAKLALNWLLRAYVQMFVVPAFRRKKPAAEKCVSLFHPDAVKLAKQDERFTLWQHDLLDVSPEQFDIVRAMTVLGRFKGNDLKTAVRSLTGSIAEGGYLIAGFGKKECSIFRKCGNKLVHHKDVGAPFKLRSQIEAVFNPDQQFEAAFQPGAAPRFSPALRPAIAQ